MNGKKKILIVAITRLGDLLQASPTIVGLKEEYPDSKITVVIDQQFATTCTGIPGIDEVFVLDLSFVCRCIHREQDGIVEAFNYMKESVEELRKREFDYCLNMSNSSYTALLIKMLNVEDVRGWFCDEEGFRLMGDPWAMLFAAFVYHSNRDYNSLNLVDIFRCAAEVKKHPHKLCYNVPGNVPAFVDKFIEENGLDVPGPLICVQAGASQEKRQWAPSHFSTLTKILVEKLGARVIYTGSSSEKEIVGKIIEGYSSERAVSAVGKTNLDQLAGLLQRADLLITGDTGPMHVSVAVGTPVVSLFLASALGFETGPYSAGNFIIQPQVSCSPCNPNFPCSRPDCHRQVSPELVAYLAELRLKTPMGQEDGLRISADVADPRDVIIYRTFFDGEGFLDFASLNGLTRRLGEPVGFYDCARAAYRGLWKEEFADAPFKALPLEQTGHLPEVHSCFGGLNQLLELCRKGASCADQLAEVIKDAKSPVQLLKELNGDIHEVDRQLEMVSLSFPPLGALVRIFIMEKENLRGSDALRLTWETKELYRRLARRGERFGRLFIFNWERMKESQQ